MCQKLGRKCTGLVEEDVSDEEKNKMDETAHRVIRKDGVEFKIRGSFVGSRAGMGARGFGCGDNKTDDERKISTLFVGGIPFETSEEEVRSFLEEMIPNTNYIRVPIDNKTNRIKGFALAELLVGENAKTVLDQIEGLQLNGRHLMIREESQKLLDSNDSEINNGRYALGREARRTGLGGRRIVRLSRPYGDSTDSDDSISNLEIGLSGLGVGNRNPVNARYNSQTTGINSLNSARSLRTHSGGGFRYDSNGNYVGNRDGNCTNEDDNSSGISVVLETDNDPEKFHW